MISPGPAWADDQACVTLVDVQDICLSLQGKDERDKDTEGPLIRVEVESKRVELRPADRVE